MSHIVEVLVAVVPNSVKENAIDGEETSTSEKMC
jgi:hypothetical protein